VKRTIPWKLIPGAAMALALASAASAAPLQESHGSTAPKRVESSYPGQLAQDWEAGRPPTDAEIADLERAMAGQPENHRDVRRLGKAYFFQYFGGGKGSAVPKARALLARALELDPEDAESMAYLASLQVLEVTRTPEIADRDAKLRHALEQLDRARSLAPNHGAVLSVTAGTYLWFPDSYGTVPRAAEAMERIRKGMGPAFARFSHHGQQRILLTQGQAYARLGRLDEARACFEQGLAVDRASVEAKLLEEELGTLGRKKESTRR
jgi:tetratricopeptide (TPR) repeat protein